MYHLIGYLISVGKNIDALKKIAQTFTKTKFKEHLKTIAKSTISKNIDELNFDDNKREIRNALLLFNVMTIINNQKCSVRFPFNHYHKQRWDLEHIRSQTSKDISGKDKLIWANTALQYFTGIEFYESNEKDILNNLEIISSEEKGFCVRLLAILKKQD